MLLRRGQIRDLFQLGGDGITNCTVATNLIIDCGDHANRTLDGRISLAVGLVSGDVNTNGNQWISVDDCLTNHVIRDPRNPRGPDGLPFTADDGLVPVSTSVGALASSGSFPWFRIAGETNVIFAEATGSNYSPAWQTTSPIWDRTGMMRPWTNTPAANIAFPLLAKFDATNRISGTWSTNNWIGIRDFVWDFGDGAGQSGPDGRMCRIPTCGRAGWR